MEAYVHKMVESAPDQSLLELAKHLGYDFEVSASSHVEPTFWQTDMLRVFISHLAVHKKWAAGLQQALLQYGISGFVAHKDIEPTVEWLNEIELALRTCDGLVALLHEHFHESKWTDQEIGFAMGRGVPVYSVSFDQSPYGFIGRFQAFSGVEREPSTLARALFDAYRKNKQTQDRMNEVLLRRFEQSRTFAEAKERIGYLEDLTIRNPSFAKRIAKALESNSQIDGSFGVPIRVAKLVKKWSVK